MQHPKRCNTHLRYPHTYWPGDQRPQRPVVWFRSAVQCRTDREHRNGRPTCLRYDVRGGCLPWAGRCRRVFEKSILPATGWSGRSHLYRLAREASLRRRNYRLCKSYGQLRSNAVSQGYAESNTRHGSQLCRSSQLRKKGNVRLGRMAGRHCPARG
jgi:hypothetical protein